MSISGCWVVDTARNNPNDPKSGNFNEPPEGTFIIGNGIATNNLTTLLKINVSGAVKMRFWNITGGSYADIAWEPYADERNWTLDTYGASSKGVRGQFQDLDGLVLEYEASIAYDLQNPIGTLEINNDDVDTSSRDVELSLSITDNTRLDKMGFSNDGTTWSDWENYSSTKNWVLSINDGTKTVYGRFSDIAGNVYTVTDTIVLDTSAPSGTIEIYNQLGRTESTSSTTVDIHINVPDAVSMRFSNDNATWSIWETYGTLKTSWSLSSGTGTKTVYAEFLDAASNPYTTSDSIVYETTPPTGSFTINSGAASTTVLAVTLNNSVTDAIEMRFSDDGSDWSEWEAYASTKAWTLPDADGSATVYGQFRDVSGNILQINDSITAQIPPDLQLLNARESCTMNSGFLTGTASDSSGISSVQVSVDGGGYSSATGTTSWKFKLPSGASTWKKGTSHTVAVRASDTCGYQTTKTVHIKKGTNEDINGDGYADVIIGGYSYHAQGSVNIYYSTGSSGIPSSAVPSTITGESSSEFGTNVALGDINGDGYADAVVGATYYSTSSGRVYIFHSSGSSGITITSAASASSIITGDLTSEFGTSIATGDINGDGYADLIVCAPVLSSGITYVFHSSGSSGITITTYASASSKITGCRTYVAAGDINGDGYEDVIVGNKGSLGSYAGSVMIFHSAGSSGVTITTGASATKTITGTLDYYFGRAVATGDINGDGYADLIVGAYYCSPDAYYNGLGKAYIFHSTGSSGITVTLSSSATTTIAGTSHLNFGFSVASGDVNSDGYADVIVGTGTSDGKGIYIYNSTGSSGVTATSDSAATTHISTSTSNQPGYSLAMGDINGDGYTDLISGSPGYNTCCIFHSSGSSGITITSAASASSILTAASGSMGWSVAINGTENGNRDLAALVFLGNCILPVRVRRGRDENASSLQIEGAD